MTILQGVIASISGTGGGSPPPPTGADFFWAGDQDYWMAFGGINANSIFSNPAPANPAYTYPDGSYIGKTRDFTGSEWMISANLGIGGAWQNNANAITVDLWFYPTSNSVQIMSELGTQDPSSGYHYSMLEIDASGYIKAKFWQTGPQLSHQIITSSNTVELNKWNHIYFTEDTQGGHTFELNGVGTGVQNPVYFRQTPGITSEYFAVGLSDATYMVATNPFQGKFGYINIRDYVASSTYTSTVSKFRPSIINTGQTLGYDWTVEIVADLQPTTFWASMWGNEVYNNGTGHFAYLTSASTLSVGSPLGMDFYMLAEDASTKSYWAFAHTNGGGIDVYRNGVLLTKTSGMYTQPLLTLNTLLIGARHQNDGTGTNDPCPGNYYYYNITGAAMNQSMITANYVSLRSTYGLP